MVRQVWFQNGEIFFGSLRWNSFSSTSHLSVLVSFLFFLAFFPWREGTGSRHNLHKILINGLTSPRELFFLHHLTGCWRQKREIKWKLPSLFFSNNNVSCQKLQKYILYLIFFLAPFFKRKHEVLIMSGFCCLAFPIKFHVYLSLISAAAGSVAVPPPVRYYARAAKQKTTGAFSTWISPKLCLFVFFNLFSSLNIFLFFQALRASSVTCLLPC